MNKMLSVAARATHLEPRIVDTAQRITLYASSRDRALQVSRRLHDYPRAGDSGEELTVVEGVETIDASVIDTSLLGHSYFADAFTRLNANALFAVVSATNLSSVSLFAAIAKSRCAPTSASESAALATRP